MKKLKFVTMCQGGHVRSVGLKYLLSYGCGHEAMAIGWESSTPETREMMFEWADYVIVMQPQFEQYVPVRFHTRKDGTRKLFCYDVGEDRYGSPFHPELQAALKSMLQEHKLFLPTQAPKT